MQALWAVVDLQSFIDIMEWDEDLRYRFRGQFLEQGDNKMMLFAFDEPEMIKGGRNRSASKGKHRRR